MEDAKTRWSVTYTKHIKQKRKVYQDGYLNLEISTNKVKLYDECDKLLECRILKKDEVVSSGKTLTFNAYLVDVGDPEEDCKPTPDLNFQVRDKKINEQKLRNNYLSSGDGKEKKAQLNSISPSQKFIREFKRKELHKYGTPLSSPETTKAETTEWQVLYTTQVTQKAKKYHDGFLRLAACVSMGRQIMLFDETMKLLDSRFLRRAEVIRSGEFIAFDGHLVEIGECKDTCEPLADLKAQRNNCNIAGKSEEMQRQQNFIKGSKKPHSKASSEEIVDSSCSISAADGTKLSKDVSTDKPLRNAIQILSFLQKPMAVKSNDAGSTDNSTKGQLLSTKGLKDSDYVIDVPDDNQESCKNMDNGGPTEVTEIEDCPDLMSCKSMSNGPGDDRRISSEEAKSGGKVDELPSFDLGF